jgi:hypothetical protein
MAATGLRPCFFVFRIEVRDEKTKGNVTLEEARSSTWPNERLTSLSWAVMLCLSSGGWWQS